MKRVANKAEERSIAWVGALETKRGGETKTRGGGKTLKVLKAINLAKKNEIRKREVCHAMEKKSREGERWQLNQ